MSTRLKPARVTNLIGLALTQAEVAAVVYNKPTLSFIMQSPYEKPGTEEIIMLDVEYLFRVNPAKMTPDLNNMVAAQRDRINAALQQTEKSIQASQSLMQGTSRKVKWEDLPDAEMLTKLYADYDAAVDARLLATVSVDEQGLTEWNFTNEQGEHINLTADLLKNNLRLSDRLHAAWNDWFLPTKPSSEVAIKTSKAEDTKDSTQPTPEASATE